MKTLETIKKQANTMNVESIIDYINNENVTDDYFTENELKRVALQVAITEEFKKALQNKKYIVVNDIHFKQSRALHNENYIEALKHISVIDTENANKRILQIDFANKDTFNIVTSSHVIEALNENDITSVYLTDNKYKHKLKAVSYDNIIDVVKTCLAIMSV